MSAKRQVLAIIILLLCPLIFSYWRSQWLSVNGVGIFPLRMKLSAGNNHVNIIRIAAIVGLFLSLVGCATPNLFNVNPEQAVLLENSYLNINGAYYGYSFKAIDKQARGKKFIPLRPGLISAERDVTYSVPSGHLGIKILMIYAPDGVGALKDLYHLWGYVKVDVEAGKKYRGRGRVSTDKALIWIEDDNGQRISDKVKPFLVIKMI